MRAAVWVLRRLADACYLVSDVSRWVAERLIGLSNRLAEAALSASSQAGDS